jgi:hypothetical protein
LYKSPNLLFDRPSTFCLFRLESAEIWWFWRVVTLVLTTSPASTFATNSKPFPTRSLGLPARESPCEVAKLTCHRVASRETSNLRDVASSCHGDGVCLHSLSCRAVTTPDRRHRRAVARSCRTGCTCECDFHRISAERVEVVASCTGASSITREAPPAVNSASGREQVVTKTVFAEELCVGVSSLRGSDLRCTLGHLPPPQVVGQGDSFGGLRREVERVSRRRHCLVSSFALVQDLLSLPLLVEDRFLYNLASDIGRRDVAQVLRLALHGPQSLTRRIEGARCFRVTELTDKAPRDVLVLGAEPHSEEVVHVRVPWPAGSLPSSRSGGSLNVSGSASTSSFKKASTA